MRRQHHRDCLGPGLLIAVIVDRDPHGDAGIVDDDIEGAELRGDVVHHGNDLFAISDIEPPGFGVATACCDLVGDGLCAFEVIVGHGDVGAFGREHARGGAAHAAGSSGDQRGQSLHRPAELLEIGHLALASMWAILTRLAPIPRQLNLPMAKARGF